MVVNPTHLLITAVVMYLQLRHSHSCGVPRISQNYLIVNGQDTLLGRWPWHAALYRRTKMSDEYVCGATLINAWFLLTAAHCTKNPDNYHQLPSENFFVRLGVYNLKRLNKQSLQEHGIDEIFMPENVNITQEQLINDIALLKLSTKADFDQYVQPACLNTQENLVGRYGTAIGWGWTESDSLSTILKSSSMPVVSDIACLVSNRDAFSRVLHEGIFCAGYTNGTAVCNGDSGGGLFFKDSGVWYLGGIIALSTAPEHGGNMCNPKGYGAFTKISKYMPWIRNVTGSEMIADSGATSYFDSIDKPYNDITIQAADNNNGYNYNAPAYWPVHQGEIRFSDTSPEYIDYSNHGAYNVPNTMNGPVISVRTSSSGPQHEHIKYTDENGGTVEKWRSHSVQTDPHTGQVIGTASNYSYEYSRTQVGYGNGPRSATFVTRSSPHFGGIDLSNAQSGNNGYNYRKVYSYQSQPQVTRSSWSMCTRCGK